VKNWKTPRDLSCNHPWDFIKFNTYMEIRGNIILLYLYEVHVCEYVCRSYLYIVSAYYVCVTTIIRTKSQFLGEKSPDYIGTWTIIRDNHRVPLLIKLKSIFAVIWWTVIVKKMYITIIIKNLNPKHNNTI